jgi:hypothetical protein
MWPVKTEAEKALGVGAPDSYPTRRGQSCLPLPQNNVYRLRVNSRL